MAGQTFDFDYLGILILHEGQTDGGTGALDIFSIEQSNFATVRAGNLLRKRKAYATSGGLGGVEGDEQVLRIGDAHSAVFNGDHEV